MRRNVESLRAAVTERRRSAIWVVGIAVTAVIATVTTTSASDVGRSGESLTLYAESRDAGALIQGNDVRMFGVKIGVVKKLEVVRNNTARLTLDLTSVRTPIHTDATLRVRPVSLLGERYLELDPGTASAPRAENDFTFPAKQVSRAVDLDEVLDTVDNPTGTALSAIVQTLGEGLKGNGDTTSDAVTRLAPSMKQADQLVSLLDQQTGTLQQLIDALQPVSASLAANGGSSIDSLVDSAGRLLAATSDRQEALQATLEQLPATLVAAQRTLTRLSGLADQATPALKSARPFTDDLNKIAGEATDFSNAASPAIATLKPVLAKGRELVAEAAPLVAQLRSSREAMTSDAVNGARFLNDLSDHLGGLLDFITYWSLTTNGKDGLSHYFRVQAIVNPDTVVSAIPRPPKASGSGGLSIPGVGTGTSTSPGKLPLLGNLNLGGLLGLGGSRAKAPQDRDSATGLSVTQESNLLGMLLGGSR